MAFWANVYDKEIGVDVSTNAFSIVLIIMGYCVNDRKFRTVNPWVPAVQKSAMHHPAQIIRLIGAWL